MKQIALVSCAIVGFLAADIFLDGRERLLAAVGIYVIMSIGILVIKNQDQ